MPGGPFSGSFARGIDHRPVLDEVGQPAFRAASEGARQFTVHPADLLQGRCPVEPDSALKITQLFHSGLGFAPLGKAKSFLAHCPESHRPGCRPVFPVLDERVVFVCGIPQVLPPAFLRSEAFTSMPQPHAVFEVVHSSQEPGIPSALGRGKRPKALAPSGQVALDLITSVEPLACRACHTGHYRAYRGRSRAAARVLGGPRPRAGRRARADGVRLSLQGPCIRISGSSVFASVQAMTWFLHWSTSSKTSLPPAGKDSAGAAPADGACWAGSASSVSYSPSSGCQ